ncbi:Ubiquinol-cytochrome C reductase hinge domain [Trinorchestia longiramus]|nr:Ubiquinol-cytochrome C reductase hinge domain [Trinorchestia longiramus]
MEDLKVHAAAPDEEEEEEEEDLVDPHVEMRETCTKTSACAVLKEKLEECSDRVNSKSNTSETCYEELIDLIQCVDHCLEKTLFSKLV